jgi:ribose transport system substrate-binding protein
MFSRPRLILAVLAAALSFVVAACGDDDSGGGGGSSGGKKTYKMTLIAGVKGDEFYITMNCGAQAEAKKLGVDLDFQGPDQFDATLQTPIVNGVIAKKPDAILIAPTDSKAMYAPIKQAADAGIKIVLVDTTLEQADLAVSQIASDNVGGGKSAAKALSDAIGGSGKVFVNNTKPGISTTDQRAQGFEEEA